MTDHSIRYRHFTLPPGSPFASTTDSAKVLLRHDQASTTEHALYVVVELGADFNQGRYVDPANLARERAVRAGRMLCELVFMSYAPPLDTNQLTIAGEPAAPVQLRVARSPLDVAAAGDQDALAVHLFAQLGAQPVLGEAGLALQEAAVGGFAHEVGTLRMTDTGNGVVDDTLKFLAHDNLYACVSAVVPTSPAANPSLTLAALALRLAQHLSMP